MTKKEQYRKLKLQLESLTGKQVKLISEADEKTYKINANGLKLIKDFEGLSKLMDQIETKYGHLWDQVPEIDGELMSDQGNAAIDLSELSSGILSKNDIKGIPLKYFTEVK